MAKHAGSRVFHCILVIPCAILCIIAVISFGSFASEYDKIRKALHDDGYKYYCVLFMESFGKDSGKLFYGDNGPCTFAVWGEVCVFLMSILIGAIFIVKAVIGVKVLTFFSFVELCFVILTGLLDFAVAIVISAGLDRTCAAFDDAVKHDHQCSRTYIESEGHKFYYYQKINTAKATAWIGTGILAVMSAIHVILLCMYCYRCKRQQESVPYAHMDHDEEDSKLENDSKPENELKDPVDA